MNSTGRVCRQMDYELSAAFFFPDCTVGPGFAPDHVQVGLVGFSCELPPIGNWILRSAPCPEGIYIIHDFIYNQQKTWKKNSFPKVMFNISLRNSWKWNSNSDSLGIGHHLFTDGSQTGGPIGHLRRASFREDILLY